MPICRPGSSEAQPAPRERPEAGRHEKTAQPYARGNQAHDKAGGQANEADEVERDDASRGEHAAYAPYRHRPAIRHVVLWLTMLARPDAESPGAGKAENAQPK